MADKNFEVSTVFTADIGSFQKSTQDMQRYIKQVNSEFKAAVGGSRDFEKSADGLKVKLEQLGKVMQAEQQILKNKEANLDKLKKKYGENSKEVQDYTIQINNQKAKIVDIQRNMDKYAKALEEMGDEAKQAAKQQKELEDATKQMSDGFTVAKGAIAGFIANGLTALASSAKNAISNVLGLADATREYRKTLSTLETVAQDVGISTDYIKEKFMDVASVIGDDDTVTEGLANLLNAGIVEENMDAMVQALEGGAIRFKDTLKFEGIADGLQETLATGSAVGPFAEMLERSSVNLETFDAGLAKCTTEAEKQNYVLDELSKLGLAEVSESYREQNAQMIEAERANKKYQDTVAAMGERLEPVTTSIREGFTRILEKMLELFEGVDMEAFAGKIANAFDGFINNVLPKIISGLQWIIDHKDIILAGIVAIGSAFLAWKVVGIITGIVKAFKAWQLATQGMTIAQKALNLVMKANPIGIIITAVTALVAAFVYLWNNCEGFRKFFTNMWDKIVDKVKLVVKSFKGAFQAIKDTFGKLKSFFSDLWDGITSKFKSIGTKVADAIGGAFKSAINAVIATVEKAINNVPNAINKALKYINKLPGVEIGKIPTITLPRLAKGGIVDKSTIAQIGEAGKEAIVPLERNTQGLKKMAGMVAEELKASGMGGVNVTYNNSFTNMPTSRYAIKKAMADSTGMYQLYEAVKGGI